MPDRTLTDALTKKMGKTNNTDPLWVSFITDHRHYLTARSDQLQISNAEKEQFKYKFDFFLRLKHVDSRLHWIIRIINDLNQYDSFANRDYLYIPHLQDISTLYRQYQTSNNVKEVDLR